MTTRTFDVEVTAHVRVTVDVDAKGAEPWGGPLDVRRQEGIYDLSTEPEIVAHLAYNAAANGVEDGRRLDGWADLPAGAIQMQVVEYDVDEFDVTERPEVAA